MENKRKLISILTAFGIVVTSIWQPKSIVNAKSNEDLKEVLLQQDNIATSQIKELCELPEIVRGEQDDISKYKGRIKEAENDLYTIVLQNEDGTNTMKMYSYPVKYKDKSGKVKDISTKIKKNSLGDFVTADNDIITTFNETLEEGIFLKHEDTSIKMTPVEIDSIGKAYLSDDEKRVYYSYGEETILEYSLTYTGFKENIIVNEYTGQTEYEFYIETNGLELKKIDGSYYLVDEEGNIDATIGDVIIITADERNNSFGDMTHEVIKENEKYIITVHVSEEYLKDEKTKYPIKIDPTIEINEDDGAGAIEDVTVNSMAGSNGSSSSLIVGKRQDYGISRVLMRFPTLNLKPILTKAHVVSASVEIRDLMCEADPMSIECCMFNGNSWTEDTATWSNANASSYGDNAGNTANTTVISYANGLSQTQNHRYSIDISKGVRMWKLNMYDVNKGIIIKAVDSVENGSKYIHKTFASYNRSSYKPSLTITYLTATNHSWGTISTAKGEYVYGTNQTFTFTPDVTTQYIIQTDRPGTVAVEDTRVILYDSAGNIKAQNYDISSTSGYSRIAVTLTAGKTYKVLILQESYSLAINCFLAIYKPGWLTVEDIQNYSLYQHYSSKFKDFEVIERANEIYNCLAYVVGYVTQQFWYSAIEGGNMTMDEVEAFLEMHDYRISDVYSENCIVAYGPSYNSISHFAKVEDGVVSSKMGEGELMKHKGVNAFFSTGLYGTAQAYFVRK